MSYSAQFCLFFFQALATLCKTARPVFGERNLNSCAPDASSTKTEVSKVESGQLWTYRKANLAHPAIYFVTKINSFSWLNQAKRRTRRTGGTSRWTGASCWPGPRAAVRKLRGACSRASPVTATWRTVSAISASPGSLCTHTHTLHFLSFFVFFQLFCFCGIKESHRWLPEQELQGLEHQKSSQNAPTKEQVSVSTFTLLQVVYILFRVKVSFYLRPPLLINCPLAFLSYSHWRVVRWCDSALPAQWSLPVLQGRRWPRRPHSNHDNTRLQRNHQGCQVIRCVLGFESRPGSGSGQPCTSPITSLCLCRFR